MTEPRKPSVLDAPTTEVRAISASRAAKLARMGICTVRDLLRSYPHRYVDLTQVSTAAAAPIGEVVTVTGELRGLRTKQPRPRLHVTEAVLLDDTGGMGAVWFRQPWVANRLQEGERYAFTGKVDFDYGMKRMNSPHVEPIATPDAACELGMLPVHHATEGVSATWMRRLVANAIEFAGDFDDPLPAALRRRYRFMGRKAALRAVHFPVDCSELDAARRRLGYEEALFLQLEMMLRRNAEVREGMPHAHVAGEHLARLQASLPFELTDEQRLAVAAIRADMERDAPMNRMLLGDVGTGKTIVAAHALALAADSASQAALMAPTEVLARQHGNTLGPLLESCGVACATLTGSTPPEERASILAGLACGSIQVVFGTHALIEPDVLFANLSLAVIDEQHRFGVDQRAALRGKGEAADLLVMTATPIPRTLALTLYGDLETTFIRQRPANRPPVSTAVISRSRRDKAYEAICAALAKGQQAYIVCPLVGLSRQRREAAAADGSLSLALAGAGEVADLKAAEEESAFLQAKVFPTYTVGLLTGRMSPAAKQQVMEQFNAGDIDVLVSTTVVEVGVDVPNATVMMIEDAERFGLSQLHQLRGRVGRGSVPGKVFLVADPGDDDSELQRRLEVFVQSSDGFALAEADLAARREGDVLGTAQHGASLLRLVNIIEDAAIIQTAHEDARDLLALDPLLSAPEHAGLKHEADAMFANEEGKGRV